MKRDYLILLLVTLVAFTLPMILPGDYYVEVFLFMGINILVALGLSLLMGYAGQISLGHAGFYGMGAYISGALTAHLGWPVSLAALVALVATALVAALVGWPTLRLRGHYLAMATLGLGIILYILFVQLKGITGGASGLSGIQPVHAGDLYLDTPRRYCYLVWSLVILAFLFSLNLVKSRSGLALRALHYSEVAASTLGIDVAKYKLQVFVFSCVLAALGGVLYAHYITFISPETFGFMYSIKLVVMIVLGGMYSLWGALLGGAFLSLLPEFLHRLEDLEVMVHGLILLMVLIFLPGGLTGLIQKIGEKIRGSS